MGDLNFYPSPSTVTHHGLQPEKGLMEKAPASAAGFRKKGEFPAVTLKRYWISRGQRSCLHSKFSISFMSRQPGDIWQQEEVKREA